MSFQRCSFLVCRIQFESQWWRNKQNINDSVTQTDFLSLSDLVPCGVESWGRSPCLFLSSRLCSIIYWRAASSSSSSSVLILSNSMTSRWRVPTLLEDIEESGRCVNLWLKHSWFKSHWGWSTSLLLSHHVALLTAVYTFYLKLCLSHPSPTKLEQFVNSKSKQKAGRTWACWHLL